MKKQDRFIIISAILLLCFQIAISQEVTEALSYPHATSQPSTLEPLAISGNHTDSPINSSEKDLMYAGGGFEGDGQKIVAMQGGEFIVIACVIAYAVFWRIRTRRRKTLN